MLVNGGELSGKVNVKIVEVKGSDTTLDVKNLGEKVEQILLFEGAQFMGKLASGTTLYRN